MNRQRISACFAAAALGLSAGPAWAQAPGPVVPGLTPELDACIRANVAAVERAVPALDDAVFFLTDQLCASEVAGAYQLAMQAENDRYIQSLQEACERERAAAPKPDEWGAMPYYASCATLEAAQSPQAQTSYNWALYPAGAAPFSATALAAQLLLEARLARTP